MRWRELAMTTAQHQCSGTLVKCNAAHTSYTRCDADVNMDMVEAAVVAAVPDVLYA